MEAEKDKKPGDGSEHITLKILDQEGNEVFFKVRRNAKLKQLMKAYCGRKSVAMEAFRFLFDGHRVREEQTPDQAGLNDGDEIDAFLDQTGAGWKS